MTLMQIIKDITARYCPSCLHKLDKVCTAGGRCTRCMSSLSSIDFNDINANLEFFDAKFRNGALYNIHAENGGLVRKALEELGETNVKVFKITWTKERLKLAPPPVKVMYENQLQWGTIRSGRDTFPFIQLKTNNGWIGEEFTWNDIANHLNSVPSYEHFNME